MTKCKNVTFFFFKLAIVFRTGFLYVVLSLLPPRCLGFSRASVFSSPHACDSPPWSTLLAGNRTQLTPSQDRHFPGVGPASISHASTPGQISCPPLLD